jgi:WD40 repeat protein
VAGNDGTVRVFDARDGHELVALRGHIGAASAVAFNGDGSLLASASVDGTVRVWALRLDDLEDIAQDEVTRSLTDAECRRYLHTDGCAAA